LSIILEVCHNVPLKEERWPAMLFAGRAHAAFARLVAGLLLLLPASSPSTTEICKEVHLKPLHCVCGIVINALGEPVARARVTILRDGTGRAAIKTGEDGKFSFDDLKAGNYEVQVQAEGFRTFQFPIVLVKPDSKCKRALEVELTTGYPENCTDVHVVKL
jgi:carboxypeptidase family protein